jgi:hypothetical protein
MDPRTTLRTGLGAGAEVLGWWAALLVLWLTLITTVDRLELTVGVSVSLLGALAARAARRAASPR